MNITICEPEPFVDEILADGPAAYWPCNDGSGFPQDVSGNGLHVVSGSTTYADDDDHGIVLDGLGLNSTAAAVLNATTWTIEFDVLLAPGGAVSLTIPLTTGGHVRLAATDSGGNTSAVGTVDLDGSTPNNASGGGSGLLWRHVALTRSGSQLRIYTEGAMDHLVPVDAGPMSPSGGVSFTTTTGSFIARVAMHDVALDGTRLTAHSDQMYAGADPGDPVTLDGPVLDDFDRADGPIGNTSLLSVPWIVPDGSTWVIDTNRARADSVENVLAVAYPDLDASILVGVRAVSCTIERTSGYAFVGFQFGTGESVTLVIGNDEVFFALASAGSWQSVTGPNYIDASVPLTLTLLIRDADEQDQMIVSADVNGTNVGCYIPIESGDVPPFSLGDILQPMIATDSTTTTFDDFTILSLAEVGGGTPAPSLVGGVQNLWYPTDVQFLASTPASPLHGGLLPPSVGPAVGYLGSTPAPNLNGGVRVSWSLAPIDPSLPPITPGIGGPNLPPGAGPPTAELSVAGFANRLDAQCQPAFNDAGTGSFVTVPPGPSVGQGITYRSGGSAVFFGIADQITTTVAAEGEEHDQNVAVTTPGALGLEWGDTVVWPDFGAMEPDRLGAPAQDDREFGWPMNGLIPVNLALTKSIAGDNTRYGTPLEIFPLPDNWPDVQARWMWDRDPDQLHAPKGWCYFRVPFGSWTTSEYAMFVCAYDYAEVWVDGQKVATADKAGATVRVDLTLDGDFHLVAIAAYNEGGKAGVLWTMMPKTEAGLHPAVMNSRPGWHCAGYPKEPIRATVGKTLRRLHQEAKMRGAPAGKWSLAFSDTLDSAGNAWPTDDSLITIRVGTTYWDVLMQLAEDRIDFRASPGGRTLYAYVKDQGGVSRGIPWTHAVDADSIETRTRGH